MLITSVFFQPTGGFAKDSIIWLITHWPPLMELDKTKQNIIGGQYGEQLNLLQKSLPDYEHINLNMPWNRFWIFAKEGEHACNCMAYKNKERLEFSEFSLPFTLILPNHIIMRKETIKKLGDLESLSLVELMQDKRFTGLLIKNRSYARNVDDLLQKHEKKSNITRHVINEESSLRMLSAKRTDYIIEYPSAVNHTVDKYIPKLKGEFAYVPIKEVAKFYYVYVACPKNEWGKKLIGKINDSLKKLRPEEEFRKQMKLMYGEDQLNKTVWQLYDEHLLKVTE